MKRILILTVMMLIIGRLAGAQDSHLSWFAKNPDDAAEAMSEKLEKSDLKILSINDVEEYEYDKRGKKTKTVKRIKRVLELPENKLILIEYDTKNVIKSFALSSTSLSDIAAFTGLFGINKWITVIEEPEMVMKTTSGFFSKFYIYNEKRPSGLETKNYSLFIEKEMPQDQLAKQNVPPFSMDSLTIYTSAEKVRLQMIALLEGLGQKYLITEAEEAFNVDNSGDLGYYSKAVLFKDGLNFQVVKRPNHNLGEIIISCQNPIVFLKIKRLMVSATMEPIEKTDTYINYKYRNLEIMERAKEKIVSITVYPYENDIAGRLSNAPTLNFQQIMDIYEKYKGDIAKKEAFIAKTFLNKVNIDWKDKTLMPDLKYNDKKDFYNYFYFLSPNNKIVACRIMSNITPEWTATFIAESEDTDYINKLIEDYKKSKYSHFGPTTLKKEGTQVYQFRLHDPRKEEERERNNEQEKQERLRQEEENAALKARVQARKYERTLRNLNTLNGVLNQIQQQTIKK